MTRNAKKPSPARQRRAGRNRSAGATRWLWALPVIALVIIAVVFGLRFLGQATPTSNVSQARGESNQTTPTVGSVAPDGTFVTMSGQEMSVASLRGHATLLWFVSTWCSSCQAGTQAMASEIGTFRRAGVHVVELELYNDLGQPGPDVASFARTYGGNAIADPDWTFGDASRRLSQTYDAQSYLDIYYLLNAEGRIVYINGSPAASMPQLLSQVRQLA
jgi:cytochrome oxidase Cu insertion factor (SCO1/SenC/PrrC family)